MATKLYLYVAFLRGVNMGGNNMVNMKKLKASMESHGFEKVVTYINSGNVLFESAEKDVAKLELEIEKMLAEEHLARSKVMIRNLRQMQSLVKAIEALGDESIWRHNVVFLSRASNSKKILEQLKLKEDIEKVMYLPGVLLWSVKHGHMGKSRLGRLSGLALYQEMSARNTNTPRNVHALMKNHNANNHAK
jgi:uncharacterized protein (DUF1697 family)